MIPAALSPISSTVTVNGTPSLVASYPHAKPAKVRIRNSGLYAVLVRLVAPGQVVQRIDQHDPADGSITLRLQPGETFEDVFNGGVAAWACTTNTAAVNASKVYVEIGSPIMPGSDASLRTSVLRPHPTLKGVYNIGALDRYLWALTRAGQTYNGTGQGGVDIVLLGDSNTFGYNTTTRTQDSFAHLYKLRMQQRYNPSGVQGGFGLVQVGWIGTSANQHIGFYSAGSPATLSGGLSSVICQLPASASIRDNRIGIQCDGGAANAARARLNVTSVDMHYVRASTATSALQFDISTGSAPGASSGGVHAQSINSNGATSYTLRATKTGLTRTANHFIQAGSGTSNIGLVQGFTLYDGDEACGVRVHNLGAPSRTLQSFIGDTNFAAGNLDVWCANTGAGAYYCGLFVISSGLNECGTLDTPSRTVAQYEADLEAVIARVRNTTNCPSQPCILLRSQFPGGPAFGTQMWARTENRPQDYIEIERQVASRHSDIVCYDCTPEAFGFYDINVDSNPGIWEALGFGNADEVHMTSRGAIWHANRLMEITTGSR